MLPGNSSKNKNVNRLGTMTNGGKKLKQNKYDGGDEDHDGMNELLLQYNLEKMTEGEYDFNHCDIYPFASTLSNDFESLFDFENVSVPVPTTLDSDGGSDDDSNDDSGDNSNEDVKINLCIYQINTSCEIPFIEFLMLRQQHEKKKVFEFPHFDYVSSKRTVLQQAEHYISDTLATLEKQQDKNNHDNDNGHNRDEETQEKNDNGITKFRGVFKHSSNKGDKKKQPNIYLFFQKYFKN